MERPLFLPLLSIITGLVTADIFLFFVPASLPYILLAACFPLLFLKKHSPFFICLALFFFSWGNLSLKPFLLHQPARNDIVQFASDRKATIEGVIDSRPGSTGMGCRIYLRCEKLYEKNGYTRVKGRILLYVGEGESEFLTGDRVRFISRVNKPRNYGLPGEFDYVRYLAYREVYVTAYVPDIRDLILVKRGACYRLQGLTDKVAAVIGRFIGARVPGEEGSVLKAVLLGDTGNISEKTKEAYAKTGVSHILSISGFHVGIVSLFVFYVLSRLFGSSEFLLLHLNVRRLILLLTIPFIVFYLFLSGAAPATVRSVIMILAYVAAMILERETHPLNSLMLAATAILVSSPPALFDISFQLSFLALWGIIVLVPLFAAPFKESEGKIQYKLLIFLMVSAAATFATLAPVAYYFHRVSFTGLVANFFIVPLVGYGAVVLCFSALPFIFSFPFLAGLLLKIAALLVKASSYVINLLATLPALPPLNPTRTDLLLFYLFLACITFVAQKKARLLLCGSLVVIFVLIKSVTFLATGNEKVLGITFFSVGQGESTLISFPDGRKMLVDGGGSLREGGMDVGKRLLAPALWSKGVDRLDYVVLSHPHPDHLKGLLYVLENFPVGEFWESGIRTDADESRELTRILAEKHVPIRLINSATKPISIGEAMIEPLAPVHHPSSPEEDVNDASLVFRLKYGAFSMLFTGDIGSNTEMSLAVHPECLSCTVLKVAHHGSRFSSSNAFLAAASPRIALISAGYGNSFGLPSGRTLALLSRRCIKVYRTDLDGTIEVLAGNNGLNVSTCFRQGHFH
jgi:competence protein ComEC